MAYRIIDYESGILIVSGTSEHLIMKQSIQRVSLVREDILELKTGNPLEIIFFRQQEVALPASFSALDLLDKINSMVTGKPLKP